MHQFLPNTITSRVEGLSSSKYIASLVKGIADMVLIFDENYRVIYANQIAEELLCIPSDELVDHNIYDLFPKQQFEFLQALLQETMEKEQVYNRRTQFQTGKGQQVPVSISFSVLAMDGELEGFMLVAKDNRHLMQATDALKQKNEQLERLFYRMSHALQGPLASIQGMLELAGIEDSVPENLRTYLNYIQTSADKLKHTLHSLMELQYANEKEATITEVSLREMLESVIDEFDRYPGRKEVLFHLTANPNLKVATDEREVANSDRSKIENSIKFRKTNTSDSVTKISVRSYKNGVKIKIKDNGLGMDRTMQQRAFNMFYRGHEHAEGSGLGLFIAKSNIEKLGGEITLKGQPFLGTEVSIYIPCHSFKENNSKVLLG
ncbi:MAG: ATP-binding protein [Cyclobacteriaceae bacterium]